MGEKDFVNEIDVVQYLRKQFDLGYHQASQFIKAIKNQNNHENPLIDKNELLRAFERIIDQEGNKSNRNSNHQIGQDQFKTLLSPRDNQQTQDLNSIDRKLLRNATISNLHQTLLSPRASIKSSFHQKGDQSNIEQKIQDLKQSFRQTFNQPSNQKIISVNLNTSNYQQAVLSPRISTERKFTLQSNGTFYNNLQINKQDQRQKSPIRMISSQTPSTNLFLKKDQLQSPTAICNFDIGYNTFDSLTSKIAFTRGNKQSFSNNQKPNQNIQKQFSSSLIKNKKYIQQLNQQDQDNSKRKQKNQNNQGKISELQQSQGNQKISVNPIVSALSINSQTKNHISKISTVQDNKNLTMPSVSLALQQKANLNKNMKQIQNEEKGINQEKKLSTGFIINNSSTLCIDQNDHQKNKRLSQNFFNQGPSNQQSSFFTKTLEPQTENQPKKQLLENQVISQNREINRKNVQTNSFLMKRDPSLQIMNQIETEIETNQNNNHLKRNLNLQFQQQQQQLSFFSPKIQTRRIDLFTLTQNNIIKTLQPEEYNQNLYSNQDSNQEIDQEIEELRRKINYSNLNDENLLILENQSSEEDAMREDLNIQETNLVSQNTLDTQESFLRNLNNYKSVVMRQNSKSRSNSFIRGSPRRFLQRDQFVENQDKRPQSPSQIILNNSYSYISPKREKYFSCLTRESLEQSNKFNNVNQTDMNLDLSDMNIEQNQVVQDSFQKQNERQENSHSKINQIRQKFMLMNNQFDSRHQELFAPQNQSESSYSQEENKNDEEDEQIMIQRSKLQNDKDAEGKGASFKKLQSLEKNFNEQLRNSKMTQWRDFESGQKLRVSQNIQQDITYQNNQVDQSLQDDLEESKNDSQNQSIELDSQISPNLNQNFEMQNQNYEIQHSPRKITNKIGLKFKAIMNKKSIPKKNPKDDETSIEQSYSSSKALLYQETLKDHKGYARIQEHNNYSQERQLQIDPAQQLNSMIEDNQHKITGQISNSQDLYENTRKHNDFEQLRFDFNNSQIITNPESNQKPNSKFNEKIQQLREKMQQNSAQKQSSIKKKLGVSADESDLQEQLQSQSNLDISVQDRSQIDGLMSNTYAMDVNESFGLKNTNRIKGSFQGDEELKVNNELIESHMSPLRNFTEQNEFDHDSFKDSMSAPKVLQNPNQLHHDDCEPQANQLYFNSNQNQNQLNLNDNNDRNFNRIITPQIPSQHFHQFQTEEDEEEENQQQNSHQEQASPSQSQQPFDDEEIQSQDQDTSQDHIIDLQQVQIDRDSLSSNQSLDVLNKIQKLQNERGITKIDLEREKIRLLDLEMLRQQELLNKISQNQQEFDQQSSHRINDSNN